MDRGRTLEGVICLGVFQKACTRIWEGYKIYALTAMVQRNGFHLVGVADNLSDILSGPSNADGLQVADMFALRGESVLEHQAKVAWLAAAFHSNFTGYFFDNTDGPMSARNFNYLIPVVVGLCHDVGELATGDVPDDGNPEHGTKDATEFETYLTMLESFMGDDWYEFRKVYREFQTKSSALGQAIYALDKVEAVLTNLLLESYGKCGSLEAKPTITGSDKYYMEQTGSDKPADCWGAHMCSLIREFPNHILKPITELLRVAFCDVRGEVPDWLTKDILPFEAEN